MPAASDRHRLTSIRLPPSEEKDVRLDTLPFYSGSDC